VKWVVALLALGFGAAALARESPTVKRTTTLTALFPAEELRELTKILPADREVRFQVRMPASADASGVLVFVSPTDSGGLPEEWVSILDERRLLWIAADGYGNSRPTAARMLVAVMGLEFARQLHATDESRRYVAGMSGGGRVASQAITHFPRLFTGAIFMVGADYVLPQDPESRELAASRRLVFVTGSRDFNQREMKANYSLYQQAGFTSLRLLDDRGFGHEYANPRQLVQALDFLEGR